MNITTTTRAASATVQHSTWGMPIAGKDPSFQRLNKATRKVDLSLTWAQLCWNDTLPCRVLFWPSLWRLWPSLWRCWHNSIPLGITNSQNWKRRRGTRVFARQKIRFLAFFLTLTICGERRESLKPSLLPTAAQPLNFESKILNFICEFPAWAQSVPFLTGYALSYASSVMLWTWLKDIPGFHYQWVMRSHDAPGFKELLIMSCTTPMAGGCWWPVEAFAACVNHRLLPNHTASYWLNGIIRAILILEQFASWCMQVKTPEHLSMMLLLCLSSWCLKVETNHMYGIIYEYFATSHIVGLGPHNTSIFFFNSAVYSAVLQGI